VNGARTHHPVRWYIGAKTGGYMNIFVSAAALMVALFTYDRGGGWGAVIYHWR
jgi:predicted phage tail protein